MAIEDLDDIHSQTPHTKRARIEESSPKSYQTPPVGLDNKMDKMNESGSNPVEERNLESQQISNTPATNFNPASLTSGIPGLGMLQQQMPISEPSRSPQVQNNRPESPHGVDNLQHDAFNSAVNTSVPTQTMTEKVHIPANMTTHLDNMIGVETASNTESVGFQGSIETHKSGLDDSDEGPSVTSALEALLGSFTPPVAATTQKDHPTMEENEVDTDMTNGHIEQKESVLENGEKTDQPITVAELIHQNVDHIPETEMIDASMANAESQEAEFEVDSSPYESSSDDSDSDTTSDDSDDEDPYNLLSPEEQARILMEGDGGSDDEGGNKGGKGSGVQLRTKNEVPEEVIPKPDVTITPEMKIEELGKVEAVVESILLIKAKISGEYRVLEGGSVLCLEDRSVIGVVAETLGRVQQPLYSVRFTNAAEVTAAGLSIGTKVFYSEQHSTYVFTQSLKAYKGSDASNLHDEEVGDEEMEFSDDEAEAEHKRRVKQKRLDRQGKRAQNGGPPRGAHPLRQEEKPFDASHPLNYDEADDGPYKPLTRPAGFADTVGRSEAPQEGVGHTARPMSHGRDRNLPSGQSRDFNGNGRGRGDRGRGRGDRGRGADRGRGRGGYQDRRNDGYPPPGQDHASGSYSQPPQDPRRNNYSQQPQSSSFEPGFPHLSQPGQGPDQYPTQQSPFQPPPFPQPHFQQMPYQQMQYQQPHPQAGWSQPPSLPAGAFINPAFFGNQQQQQPPSGQQWMPPAQQPPPQSWLPYPPSTVPPPPPQFVDSSKAFNDVQEKLRILRELGK